MKPHTRRLRIGLLMLSTTAPALHAEVAGELLLSDEAVPWQDIGKDFIKRPLPVTEAIEDLVYESNRERKEIIAKQNETGEDLNPPPKKTIFGANPFLNSGLITPGFEIPTGAVWQPTVVIYGNYRIAAQHFDNGLTNADEIAHRLDLFTNIYLTPTERILFSIRPLDKNGRFNSYRFDSNNDYQGTFNSNIRSLYFEGDFGELFPGLDPNDNKSLDYGFAIGRMPLNFQDGILINDSIDAFGVTRASMFNLGASASRLTALVGWNDIHRGNNIEDEDATLFGLFWAGDYWKSTYEVDLAYVDSDNPLGGDGLYFGIGQTRRFGKINSTLRANFSKALDNETASIDTGILLFSQLSRTMDYNFDIAYINTFLGIGNYTSAARDPSEGGPIGGINGLLFGAVGLGRYGSAIGNGSNDAVGGSIGYQHFLDGAYSKRQLIAEIGGRIATDGNTRSGGGIGLGYQQALDQHAIIRVDSFIAAYDDHEIGTGVRLEYSYQF